MAKLCWPAQAPVAFERVVICAMTQTALVLALALLCCGCSGVELPRQERSPLPGAQPPSAPPASPAATAPTPSVGPVAAPRREYEWGRWGKRVGYSQEHDFAAGLSAEMFVEQRGSIVRVRVEVVNKDYSVDYASVDVLLGLFFNPGDPERHLCAPLFPGSPPWRLRFADVKAGDKVARTWEAEYPAEPEDGSWDPCRSGLLALEIDGLNYHNRDEYYETAGD